MSREIEQATLPRYRGKFSWHINTLRGNIKAVKPNYSPYDPKTWPIITADMLGETYTGSSLLPTCAAYDRKLVELCVRHHDNFTMYVGTDTGQLFTRDLYFHHFPFVYDSEGRAHDGEYIDTDQYVTWVRGCTGRAPKTNAEGNNNWSDALGATDSAYVEILNMLHEAHGDTDAEELESLKQELAKTKKELENEKKRADAAEKAKRVAKAVHEEELAVEKMQHESLQQNLRTKEELLRRQNIDLVAANRAAATAKQQIMTIRDEMKKTRETGPGKRKTPASDDGGPVEKKAKTEQ